MKTKRNKNILPERSFQDCKELFDNMIPGQTFRAVARKSETWNQCHNPEGLLELESYCIPIRVSGITPGTIVQCLDSCLSPMPMAKRPYDPELGLKIPVDQDFWARAFPKFSVNGKTMWIHVSWLEKV